MRLCVGKTEVLKGTVEIPGSKSYTHRALIVSLLADKSRIRRPLISADTLATKDACEAFGARISERGGDWIVKGTGGNLGAVDRVIDVRNSGTTLRFITSLAALSRSEVAITGDESIRKRPLSDLLDVLRKFAHIEDCGGFAPLKVKNRGGVGDSCVEIRGDLSSQFISSLLLIAPLVGLEIRLTTPLKSRPYVDITLDVMAEAGVGVEKTDKGFYVKRQSYGDIDYRIPGDFSSAANILCPASFIESDVRLKNLDMGDAQGDKRVIDILRDAGALIDTGRNRVRVMNSGELNALRFDASDIPDIVPPLVAVFCFAEGRSVIKNIGHLRYKESDRLEACNEFRKLNADVVAGGDSIVINGPREIKAASLNAFNDHRMIMSLASAAMKAEEGITVIDPADMLNVSFPKYLGVMQNLGANMWIEE